MLIQSSQEANIQINFFEHIYKSRIDKLLLYPEIDIHHGRKILTTEAECDKYIALYGGHHFHKLYAAFPSTNFQYIHGKSIEVIDWGCGQAIATCVLIDYLFEQCINPKIESITLIEPSSLALWRGYGFVHQMLRHSLSNYSIIRTVNKDLDNLNSSDLFSKNNNLKIHLFSNILDVEDFDLDKLYHLIINSFKGINRIICISPYHNAKNYRIDYFHDLFNAYPKAKRIFHSDESIHREIFYNKTQKFEIREIKRYEKQFTIKL